jgi:hypothetical protein
MRALNTRDNQYFQAAQTKFLRPLTGFTKLDHQENGNIKERLQVGNTVKHIRHYEEH